MGLVIGADVGSFRLESDLCSLASLVPGASCTMAVRFAPTHAGHAEAKLLIITGDGHQRLVALSGDAEDPSPSAPETPAQTVIPTSMPSSPAGAARVALERRNPGLAHYRDGRVRLGRAHCEGAPACTVVVRSRFVIDTRRGPRIVRGEEVIWSPDGGRVSVPLPMRRRGTPTQVLLKLTTSADGHPTGTQVIALKLEPKP